MPPSEPNLRQQTPYTEGTWKSINFPKPYNYGLLVPGWQILITLRITNQELPIHLRSDKLVSNATDVIFVALRDELAAWYLEIQRKE